MKLLMFALRALGRDLRAGELRVLLLALIVAVASVTSVGFFTDRVRQGMAAQAGELLAADLVVSSTAAPRALLRDEAERRGLRSAQTWTFPSVVLVGERAQLAEVKAVSPDYPLRGVLRTAAEAYGVDRPADAGPAPGTVWLDARLLAALDLKVGGSLQLGNARLRVAQVLSYEPDRGGDLFSIAPRLLMTLADLPATGLVQPGSRVSYRLLLAGSASKLADFRDWLRPRLAPNERLLDVRDARPELRSALERAERFLGLAALVSVVLAGVAVATAARRYATRHYDSSAIMRCLGASQAFVARVYLLEMLGLGLVAGAAGAVVGLISQAVLAMLLASLLPGGLPAPSAWPAVAGMLVGLITLVGFAAPPLLRLRDVPVLRVLRRDLGPLPTRGLSVYGAALAAMAALMLWQAGDARLGLLVLAGALATAAVLAAVAYGLVRALGRLRGRVGVAWRYGLANIARRAHTSVAQVLAFGLGIMALLLLTLVRGDLLNAWQKSLPPDAPNQFLINVQPDQVRALHEFLAGHGRGDTALYPMVRGRLTAINGAPVDPAGFADDRARRLAEREFNLSWAARPQPDNRIVAGEFWPPDTRGAAQLSVEEGLAKTLGLKLGDQLSYRIADQTLAARITSLRKVDWDSFQVNFFVLLPPGVLDNYPATWITSLHVPTAGRGMLAELVRAFPNVTVIDVDALMTKVRGIMERVNLAVQYVFGFTLLAGLMVLYAAIQATQDERLYEGAVLRTLGASRRQLLGGLIAEFAALGLLAGVLAALGASLAGWLLARQVFHLAYGMDAGLWLAGIVGGALGVGLFGTLGTRFVLRQPPLAVLRRYA